MFFSIVTADAEEMERQTVAHDFTELLPVAISKAGASQKEVAIDLGVSEGHLSRMLKTGDLPIKHLSRLPLNVLRELAVLFGDACGLEVVPAEQQIESRVEKALPLLMEIQQMWARRERHARKAR